MKHTVRRLISSLLFVVIVLLMGCGQGAASAWDDIHRTTALVGVDCVGTRITDGEYIKDGMYVYKFTINSKTFKGMSIEALGFSAKESISILREHVGLTFSVLETDTSVNRPMIYWDDGEAEGEKLVWLLKSNGLYSVSSLSESSDTIDVYLHIVDDFIPKIFGSDDVILKHVRASYKRLDSEEESSGAEGEQVNNRGTPPAESRSPEEFELGLEPLESLDPLGRYK